MSQISVEELIEESRIWDKHRRTLDSGSYCEDVSPDYTMATHIKKLYEQLIDERLKYERSGYKLP